jgi:type II secretion system (T2SS) protein E
VGVTVNAGPLLLRAGLITQAQLKTAYDTLSRAGGTLTEYLVGARLIDEDKLCEFFGERLMVRRVGIADLARVPRKTAAMIPSDMAAEFRVIPVDIDSQRNLSLAMGDPSDTHAIDEIHFFTGLKVVRLVAPPTAIAWALRHFYGVTTRLAELLPQPDPLALPLPAPDGAAAAASSSSSSSGSDRPDKAASRKLPPAQIVDDVYDVDTPLPAPVPFDEITGRIVLVGAAAAAETPEPAKPPDEAKATSEPPKVAEPPRATEPPRALEPPKPVEPPPHKPVDRPKPPPEDPRLPVVAANPALPEAEAALEAVRVLLAHAGERDTVAEALVGYLRRLCRRAAFFALRTGDARGPQVRELVGLTGKGIGVHLDSLREAVLLLDRPSTFRDVVNTRLPFRGPVTDIPSRDFLIEGLGWAPIDMLAIPITVRDQVVGILYGDERMHALPDDHLAQVMRLAESALERSVPAKKAQ